MIFYSSLNKRSEQPLNMVSKHQLRWRILEETGFQCPSVLRVNANFSDNMNSCNNVAYCSKHNNTEINSAVHSSLDNNSLVSYALPSETSPNVSIIQLCLFSVVLAYSRNILVLLIINLLIII